MGMTAASTSAGTLEVQGTFRVTNDSIQSDAECRLQKWQMQREAQALLPHERVAFCLRRVQTTNVNVLYAPAQQSAYYSGLMVCGSVWLCPICASKISERRRVELEQAIESCLANGGAVYLATYTIAHKRYDSLSTLLQSFLTARKRMRQGRAAQKLRQRFNILGTVSVREVTWSQENGWHPHCHELVFCAAEIDITEYEEVARERWRKSAEHEGLNINEHGFAISRASGSAAGYVAKFGREPASISWNAATELTKGHLKRGHGEEHLTPFAMLLLISQGQYELKPVFREYAEWFKGKHQLVWSAGLRALLLNNDKEPTDQELVQEPEEKFVLLGQLDSVQWRMILIRDARGKLLEVARSGDWKQVLSFLDEIAAQSAILIPWLELPESFPCALRDNNHCVNQEITRDCRNCEAKDEPSGKMLRRYDQRY